MISDIERPLKYELNAIHITYIWLLNFVVGVSGGVSSEDW